MMNLVYVVAFTTTKCAHPTIAVFDNFESANEYLEWATENVDYFENGCVDVAPIYSSFDKSRVGELVEITFDNPQ